MLLSHPPVLHADRAGNPVSWGASTRLLTYLARSLQDGQVTLETGAGVSTILFALKRTHHTAIVPDSAQVDRILNWCEQNEIATDRLKFIVDVSQRVLPSLDFPHPLDLVLIDGAHGFPLPFLDWFYTAEHLRIGGVILVDDLQIWTGQLLFRYLARDHNWSLDHLERLEFFAARKIGITEASEWHEQPYVLHRSYVSASTSPSRRIIGRTFSAYRLTLSALSISRQGDWKELWRRANGYWRGRSKPTVRDS